MKSKRLNLSFDLDDNRYKKAYNIIKENKGAMTEFIVKMVLAESERKNDKKIIKEAVREVLQEIDLNIVKEDNKKVNDDENDLPQEIFDIFEQL